jgi:hypothetical protein
MNIEEISTLMIGLGWLATGLGLFFWGYSHIRHKKSDRE